MIFKCTQELADNNLADMSLIVSLKVPLQDLMGHENGQEALSTLENQSAAEAPPSPHPRRGRKLTRSDRRSIVRSDFVSTVDVVSDDDASNTRSRKRKRGQSPQNVYRPNAESEDDEDEDEGLYEDDDSVQPRRSRRSGASRRSLRSFRRETISDDLAEDDGDDNNSTEFFDSDLFSPKPKKRKHRLSLRNSRKSKFALDGISYESTRRIKPSMRQSGRSTRHQAEMQEVGEDVIYRSDSDDGTRPAPKPKAVGAREQFKQLPRNDEFRIRHIQECETCGQGVNYAPLIYCQGCTLAYHKSCLGPRSNREHLVTKIGEINSILQCRRCVAFPRKKDPTAPDQGKCADCREHGVACLPFRPRKSIAQEQKERDESDGQDPTYEVDSSRINKAENVLFRCLGCWRGFHFEHLPSRSNIMIMDTEVDAEQRFREYSHDWRCKDCLDAPAKVSSIVAWKPIDEYSYDPAVALDDIEEDEKAYLVKWDGKSYNHACWMPGAWVWGYVAHSTRKAFSKRDDSQHPKMRAEDAIPEDFLRTDIVLDVKYTSYVEINTQAVDMARIGEIDKALIKYKGLGYEDAVWEAPPSSDDGERWSDFVMAYNDWVQGRYVRVPKQSSIKSRLERARKQDFSKLEKHVQPENVEGGELMKYQIEGLNWLYYKWFTQKNAILADEMGLGKTIQIIGFLATLVADWSCFPFLVVVPNSTCPNWRREIKRWAPTLRVVTYFGSRESRDLAYKHELFPEEKDKSGNPIKGKDRPDLRAHIVVTSYDAAADSNFKTVFKSVTWQALVVDEGQRLKNDKGLLYSSLSLLKVPFKILLTGTPLQNNQRELFNLLHFLDDSHDPEKLEEEYADLDSDKISKLHDMIRPFFLRRTKAQVLTFLPPMAQIIVPVSMTLVQKKLYRTILAKNPDLMKAIFSADASVKGTERASLNNILMQLRKCLCHPFVYNNSIEERNVSHAMSHRNLVDASAKLKLLEILLPKLRERGHRVLIFSQFLNMLDIVEDFLDGQQLPYQRLDGSISALQKQKRIDEFNAPESALFAFLLSTRAGGVGINLASADTVIILDPDFNPHQDIQALSRAHRIGQHKKVLCFQLVTRASAEERIMQMGRRKLALDHVLIQEMDADDADQNDLVSVLRHGASELFEDSGDQDVTYDGPSVDRLLDRSHVEDTKAGTDKTAETQFSFARVWANGEGALQDEMIDGEEEPQQVPNPGVWANILKERERVAAEEAAARADAYGRGRRARGNIDYNNDAALEAAGIDVTPVKSRKTKNPDESDTDFQADGSDADDDADDGEEQILDREHVVEGEHGDTKRDTGRTKIGKHTSSASKKPSIPSSTPVKKPVRAAGERPASTPPATVGGPNSNIIVLKPRAIPKGTSKPVKSPRRTVGKKMASSLKIDRPKPSHEDSSTPTKKPGVGAEAGRSKISPSTGTKPRSAPGPISNGVAEPSQASNTPGMSKADAILIESDEEASS